MAEQIGFHDLRHEVALLIAYTQKDTAALRTVEKESAICTGLQIANDRRYRQSLKANP
jgi:hypothetical protein